MNRLKIAENIFKKLYPKCRDINFKKEIMENILDKLSEVEEENVLVTKDFDFITNDGDDLEDGYYRKSEQDSLYAYY